MSQNTRRSMRAILWILIICLTACSVFIVWGRAPKALKLAPLVTPTVSDAKIYLPIVTCEKCTVIFDPGSIHYDGSDVPPGGVVCLNSGDYQKIEFENLQGTAEEPIIIRNRGGQVRMTSTVNDVYLEGCNHIHMTGAGTPGVVYGFYFKRQLLIVEKPHYIEVDHVEIDGARMRINDDTDPDFEMIDIHVHHCYVHDCGSSAFYIGHPEYILHPGDYIARRIELDNNRIENTNSQAIKVASIVEDCLIHHNVINDVVGTPDESRQAAIKIAGGCSCEVYNNKINGSGAWGILGIDSHFSHKIYNNLLIDTGNHEDYPDAFFTWSGNYSVFNNIIIGANRYGLSFQSPTESEAFNNIILDTGNDPIHKGGTPDTNFHHNLTKDDGYTPANFGFVDSVNGDYHLTSDSPAVDAGAMPSFPLTFDLDDRARPSDEYDVGAYEFWGTVTFP